MVVHAIIKASTFVILRVSSHLLNVQDYRIFLRFTNKQISSIFILLLSLLSAMPLVRVLYFKEYRVEVMSSTYITNILIYVSFVLISVIGFLFMLEYSTLINSNFINSLKHLTCPSMVHMFLRVTLVPVIFIMSLVLYIEPLSNNSLLSDYIFLFFLSFFLITLVKRRSYFLNFSYVLDYNSIFLRNIQFTKMILLEIEYYSNFSKLNKSE